MVLNLETGKSSKNDGRSSSDRLSSVYKVFFSLKCFKKEHFNEMFDENGIFDTKYSRPEPEQAFQFTLLLNAPQKDSIPTLRRKS